MDVSSLVISSIAIAFEVTSTLYSYGKQVKSARRDIQNLSNELFGLIGALEHFKLQQDNHLLEEKEQIRPPAYSAVESADLISRHAKGGKGVHEDNVVSVLNQTIAFLQELQQKLKEPKGRLGIVVHLLKWPLKDNEVQKHLSRLERVKTYFVLSLVTDEVDQSRKMAHEIVALRTIMQNATIQQAETEARKFTPTVKLCLRSFIKSGNERRAIVEWLSPVDPSVTRKAIEKAKMPGTGTWFTKSDIFQKQSSSPESSCFWLNGISML